ncbi:hypothetical protein ABW20_dc0105621 [Dactylellina cionopaga]|nr:hypothetical protein ABW20_dc0105621 [Dactylellina cionopaga]
MRIFTFLALGLTAIQGVSAICNCPQIAAQAVNCDLNDSECLCGSNNYLDVLSSCSRLRRGENCSDRDIEDARNSYVRACLASNSETTSASSSTSEPSSTSSSSSATSTTSEPSSTTSASTSASSTSSTSSTETATMTPTNTPVSSASRGSSRPALTTAQIGGVVGGSVGLVLTLIVMAVLYSCRRYKKKDKKADALRNVEAQKFMEGGRQMRAASMSQMSDRLYSTRRPLSYALGEYDSSRADVDHQDADDSDSTPPNSVQGSYFNRFSGNHLEDSTQAFLSSPSAYYPPSSFRNSQRAVSVPNQTPGGPMLPTASLSYEEYRSQESPGERSSLISEQSGSSTPHRSVSAPMPPQSRISRKPINGNSLNERTSSSSYSPSHQYGGY